MSAVSRRQVVAVAAWTVPVVAVGSPAAWAACSGPVATYTPEMAVASTTTTKAANGHTIGNFLFVVRNLGTRAVPAGTSYTTVITAEKSPGTTAKDIVVTPVTVPGVTPEGPVRLNPDGVGGAVRSRSYSVFLPAPLPPLGTFTADWLVDSVTGVGATRLRMDAALLSYGDCGQTGTGTPTTTSAYWGAR